MSNSEVELAKCPVPWIPITEKMPADYDGVLVSADDVVPCIGYYHPRYKYFEDPGGFQLLWVTHWQLLPLPPGVESKPSVSTLEHQVADMACKYVDACRNTDSYAQGCAKHDLTALVDSLRVAESPR